MVAQATHNLGRSKRLTELCLVFFIISGYVLSCKPLKQIHSQQYASLTTTLSSSVFRRALRLFLPSLITLFMMSIAVHYGISDNRFAPSYFALSSQLEHCWATCWELLTSSWKIERIGNPQPSYNPALWTIPVEFAQSMILFVTLLGLSRCVTNVRLFLLGVIMSVCIFGGQLYTVEFLGGMFIAEVILLQEHPNYTPNSSPQLPKYVSEDIPERKQYCPTIQQRALQLFWIANVISGLFIASWTNNHAEEVWGIRVLEAHTPSPYEGQQVVCKLPKPPSYKSQQALTYNPSGSASALSKSCWPAPSYPSCNPSSTPPSPST